MGGDLIEGPPNPNSPYNHRKWFAHMSNRMSDILDAYSVHVYWNYWDVARFQQRLRDVQEIAGGLAHRKPLFVTEYGTRGRDRRPNTIDDPGNFREGSANPVPLAQTNVAAFQHAWFQILAAQLGYAGTVKWDGYYGKYDRGTQAYYTIGKPETDGWPLYPTYFLLRLVTMTTEPGWRVLQLNQSGSSERTKHLAAFAGGDDELTILGLDSEGADVNTTSSTRVDYTIGGLPPRASFSLLLWNKSGNGQIVRDSTVTANADGVAQVRSVPLQSVFALTTKALPPA